MVLIVAASIAAMPAVANAQASGRTLLMELTSNINRFQRADANSNGQLEPTETLAERQRIATRDNKPISSDRGGIFGLNNDTNGDGLISLSETEVAVRARFSEQDANRDGRVTEAEKEAARRR